MPRLSKIGAAALAAFGWTSGAGVTANFLVIAGGGSGGKNAVGGGSAGGGGAGEVIYGTGLSLNPTLSYTITVGAGGATQTTSNTSGNNGNNSSIGSSVIAIGGGGGGAYNDTFNGKSGGSGGGGCYFTPGTGGASTTGTLGGGTHYGNAGGSGASGDNASGGGGGAGAVGGNASGNTAGVGGAGQAFSISGSSVTYGGGGGGGNYNSTGGAGGTGGGGAGSVSGAAASNGTANLGGGGGGGGDTGSLSGSGGGGGSGVVIISYVGAQQFGGGVVTSSGGNTIHTFQTSGTLSPLSSLTASYLIVAGGGGGGTSDGSNITGGGGAGGMQTGSGLTIDTNSIYVVTVGAGGAAEVNGSNSAFSAYATASVGGGFSRKNGAPNSGGSGGGATVPLYLTGGAATSGQGSAGGNATGGLGGGGGGGAGAVGGAGSDASGGGAGGVGLTSSISGTSTYYSGGGGGGASSIRSAGAGGLGGGGAGALGNNVTATAGTANTGGGGGGNGQLDGVGTGGTGGAGGAGVVIISYPGSVQQMAGGTVTVAGGNVIHTFTSSGFLTPIVLTTNSLRFRSSASAYLNRTPSVASNRKTWTWSAWVKLGTIAANNGTLFSAGTTSGGSSRFYLRYTGSQFQTGFGSFNLDTTVALFRDPSAWYHVVIAIDTTQATTANRLKIYVNGIQQSVTTDANYSQNDDTAVNNTVSHQIASDQIIPGGYFDGYLAEVNFIDGQALTPSSFGETSTTTGVWIPKKYTGTYGTNGFYLPFTDNSALTTSSNVGLGKDFSGNANYFATNGISITSGSTYDSMTDVPTLTSATTANYAVMNPLDSGATNSTLSNGNLTVATASTGFRYMGNTMWVASGKFYAEFTLTATTGYAQVGIAITTTSTNKTLGEDSTSWSYNSWNGTSSNNNSASSFGNSWTTNDVIGIALDKDNNKLYFSKNGTWQNSADPAAGTGSLNIASVAGLATLIGVCDNDNGGSVTFQVNFGQRPFAYTPPSGFVALNTFNLPTPTIGATASTQAGDYFNTVLYTGNGGSQSVTGVGFQPDWVWVKVRSSTQNHSSNDSVRGAGNYLVQNATAAERFQGEFDSFDSDGFSLTFDAGEGDYNGSGKTYVAWNWRANQGTNVSNTDGTITSTVSANTTAGFSIVTYTGNGTIGATIGHGLGVTPSMIIVKLRAGGSEAWQVYHSVLGATQYVQLNTTGAAASNINRWNNTAPTSTVFSVYNDTINNGGGGTYTYVAYCFAPVAGYSAFGSYTGNGSADGPFIFTGFRPKFIFIKCSSTDGENSMQYDTSMNPYNQAQEWLSPNLSAASNTAGGYFIDFVSNGVKIRQGGPTGNASGRTYIYMAFAEVPTKFSLAR
jgi:hypothetical protein